MSDEHAIIQRVYAAKSDSVAADLLISDYLPFIKAQVAKVMKRQSIFNKTMNTVSQ